MQKRVEIAGLIIVIIIIILSALFFLTAGTTITQNIVFEDMQVTKTISLGTERTEIYEFELANPIIGYLVVPKTIATSASEITISGDFKTKVIREDPILKITSSELTPGTKKLVINSPLGDTNQTTILFPFPLAEYNTLSSTEKAQLEETINAFAQSMPETFTQEKSLEIMQQYANDIKTQVSGELQESEDGVKKKLLFAGINTTLTQAINSIQQFTSLPEIFQLPSTSIPPTNIFTQALSSIQSLTIQAPANFEDEPVTMTITFKPEPATEAQTVTGEKIPSEITLPYSAKTPIIAWKALIEKSEESPLPPNTELIIEGPENIRISYEKITTNDASKNIYQISLVIDTRNYYSFEDKETIYFKHAGILLSIPEKMEITFVNNPCTTRIITEYEKLPAQESEYENALYELLACTDAKAEEAIVELLKQRTLFEEGEIAEAEKILNVELDQANIASANPNFAQMTKKLDNAIASSYRSKAENYTNTNTKLKELTDKYTSILRTKLDVLYTLQEKTTKERTKDLADALIKKYELDIAEKEFVLDPTDWRAFEEIVRQKMFYLHEFNPNLTMASTEWENIENDIRKDYLEKYSMNSFSSWEYSPILLVNQKLVEIDKQIDAIEEQLVVLVSKCDEKDDYETKWKGICKNFVHQLATADISDESFSSIKARVDGIGQNFYTSYFDTVAREKGLMILGQDRDTQATIDILRNQIVRLVKQRTGLRLIGKQLLTPREEGRIEEVSYEPSTLALSYDERENQLPQGHYIPTYEISIPERLAFANGEKTLLEIYEQLYTNDVRDWFVNGTATTQGNTSKKASFAAMPIWDQPNDPEIKYARECVSEAFAGPLRSEIEAIKHFKFLPFILTMTQAASLQHEIDFVEYVYGVENNLAAIRMAKVKKQANLNYFFSYVVSSGFGVTPYNPANQNERSYLTMEGLELIKPQLLEGKSFLEIQHASTQVIEKKFGPQPKAITYSIQGDLGGEHGQINSTYTNEVETTAWNADVINHGGDEGLMWLAFTQPIMEIELEKARLIAKNKQTKRDAITQAYEDNDVWTIRELVLPTEDAARFQMDVANFYYNNELYDEAIQQYISILVDYKTQVSTYPALAEILQTAEARTSSTVPTILFGSRAKEFWSKMGSTAREITSVESIAYIITVHGFMSKVMFQMQLESTLGQGVANAATPQVTSGLTSATSSDSVFTVVNGSNLTTLSNTSNAIAVAQTPSRLAKIFTSVKRVLTKPIGKVKPPSAAQLKRMKQLQDAYNKGYSQELCRRLKLKSIAELQIHGAESTMSTTSYTIWEHDYRTTLANLPDNEIQSLMRAYQQGTLSSTHPYYKMVHEANLYAKDVMTGKNTEFESLLRGANKPTSRLIAESRAEVSFYNNQILSLENELAALQASSTLSPNAIQVTTANLRQEISALRAGIESRSPVTITCNSCLFSPTPQPTVTTGTTTAPSEFEQLLQRQMATRTVSLPTNVINVSGGSTVFNSPLTKIIVEQAVTTGITAPLVTATPLASGVMKLLVVTATPVTVLPVTEMPEETNDDIVRIVVPTNVSVSTSTEPEQTLNNTPNSIPPGFSFTETPGELNSLNLLDAQGNRVAFVEFMPTSTLSQTKYYPFPKEGVVVEIMRADVEGLGYGQMVFEELIRRKRIVYTGYTELDGTNGGTSHSAGRMLKRVMDTGKFLFEVPGIPSKINNSGDMLRDTSIGDGLPLNEFYKVTVIPADKIGKVQNYVSRPGTPDEVVVVGPAIVSEDIAKLLTAGRRVYLEFVRLDRGEGDDIPEATDETLDALQLEIETRIATLVEMGLEQRFVEDVLSGSAEMPKTAKSTPDFANIENKIRAVREEGKQLGTGNTQGPVVELDGVPWTMQQQPYVGSAMIHILTNTNTGEKFIVKHNGVEHKSGRDREEFRFNPRTEYARAIEIPTELVEQGFYNPPIYTATDDSFNISRFIEGGEMEEGLAQYSSQTKAGASLAELAFACVSNHVVTPDVSFLGLHNIIRNNENGKPVLFDHGAQYYDPSRSTQELAEELLFDAFNRSKLSSKNVTIVSEGEAPTLTSQGRDMLVRGYVFIRELAQRTGVQHMPTSQERSKKSVISPDGSETHFIAFTHSEYIPIPQTFEEYIDYLITNLPNQIYLRPTQVNNAELTQLLESQKGSFTYTPQTNTGATGTPKTVSLPVSGTDCVNGCVASVQASALVEDPTQANLAIQQGNVVEVNDLTRVESVTIAPNPRAGINAETEILGHTFPYGTNEAVIASPEFQAIKAQFIQNAAKGDSLEERQWLASLSDEDLVKLLIQPFNTVEAESFNHGNFSSYGVFRRYVLLGVLNKIHAEPLVRLAINLQAIDYASTSGEDEEVRMADAELINTTIAHSENIVNYVATNDLSPSLTVEATISRLVEDPNRLENWENFYDAFNRVQTNLTEEQALQVLDAFNRTNYFARAIPATEKDIQKALESAPKDDGTFGIFQDSRIYIAGVESKPEELYQISIIFEQLFNKLEALGTNQVRSLEKTNAILSKWLRTRVSLAQTSQAAPQIIRGNRSAINAESPAIAELLLDPAKSRALLEGLTTIRTVYTSASKQPDLSEEDQRIWINDNVFVRTDTSSFRRHVLVEVDAAGNVVGSVEIKIPGTYKHKLQVGEADYDVAQALAPAFGEDLQQGVAVIRYAGEAYSWYGQTMTFGEFVPMQIIVSEFDYDAFQKRQRLNEFFRKAELTKSEFENIKAQVLALMEKVFENGWTGNGDLVHLQNFTIEQLADGAYKIRLVNDLAEFKRQSEMSETEVDNSVATSRYKIESDLTVHEAKANRKAKLQSGTATFTCNSPCEWDSTGHRVKVVEGTNVEITGEFEEGHVAEVKAQRYNKDAPNTQEATAGLDAEETEQAIDGFSQGKTVAILAGAASGKQEIKVYFKKELVD
ncbi:MAG: hypothetical protein HOC95_03215, partial [Candidatus Diapherotrites archaeon]|nr:hypothetical protein [Candidatus Diapherotrites archaeon]